MPSTITVGTNSFVSLADSNTYFGDRPGSSDYWVSGSDKNAAILYAYKLLKKSRRFSLPATATQAVKDAQCELAYYLLIHLSDIDIRMGLRAQGVLEAGILREKFKSDDAAEFPFPSVVIDLLAAYDTTRGMYILDVERDEEEHTDYDAPTNREHD
jgi:hypothetical protein